MKQNKSVKFWTFLWVARYKRSWRSVAFTVSSSMVRIKNFIPGKNCISSANKVRLMHCKITWFWYTAFDGPAYPKIELVHRNKRKCLTVVIFCHMIIYSFDLEEACTINSQLLRITVYKCGPNSDSLFCIEVFVSSTSIRLYLPFLFFKYSILVHVMRY